MAKVKPGKTPRISELNRKAAEISTKQFDLESKNLVQAANNKIMQDLLATFSEADLKYWADVLKHQAGQKFIIYLASADFQKALNLPYEKMQKASSEAYRLASAEDKKRQKPTQAPTPKK